ncbi:hypothetical protein NAT51_01925 [Flavobacterium amniphilum]|uniref:hypothetical protein n=1 Tax=Flavobacterium amniphilum TaxID=1834035 RepID=UPI00202ABDA4|nr:hypothetical protein [Flavobacterium amniphilum]MCL9804265.1 hypothetical protein [Flavobacterium amniphilum]
MKNFFLPILVLGCFFVSCENDDDSSNDELKLITASNTSAKVSYTNLLSSSPTAQFFTVGGVDADGAYFDSENDELIIASRTNNRLELYKGLNASAKNNTDNLSLGFYSTSDFSNPREIAVAGDKVVVTQDQNAGNGNVNKLVVYQKTTAGFTLLNSYTVNFKTWGIHIDGTTLYAVADLTSDLVVFNDFFSNPSGTISPSKRVTIQGLVRTHGITFSKKDNRMILTDVGSAASSTDGGLIVINNFSNVMAATSDLGTISSDNQIRVYGTFSKLGNPVDVAYDDKTEYIYVAERLNGGGQVLVFTNPTINGDVLPISSRVEAGVSSVYLIRK